MRKRGILVVAGIMFCVLASPAVAQQDPEEYPPQVGGLTISDATLVCPTPTTVSGSGFDVNAQVTVSIDGTPVTTVTTNAEGSFSLSVDIPGGTGQHTISASDADETASAVVTCVLAGAGAPPEAEGIAFTGANITVGLLILAGLILAGTVALVMGRRRART